MINKVQTLSESSLSRVWQHVQNRTPFAMISLSRDSMNQSEKQDAYVVLKENVRSLGYGYIELKGGYVETKSDGSTVDVIGELSLMIPNITKEESIKIGVIDLGHGPQDSILYCDGVELLAYLYTNPQKGAIGSIETKFKYDKDGDAVPMTKEAVARYFSMLQKGAHANRKFSFIPENFRLMEMGQRRSPKNKDGDWWDNFGFYI